MQWTLLGQRPELRDWLQQLFPRLTLETSKLDTNAPESICLLDFEVGANVWVVMLGLYKKRMERKEKSPDNVSQFSHIIYLYIKKSLTLTHTCNSLILMVLNFSFLFFSFFCASAFL